MLVLLGFNHRSAPVELRERLVFAEAEIPHVLAELLTQPAIAEASLLSTCNRLEVLVRCDGPTSLAFASIKSFISERRQIGLPEIERHAYQFEEQEAVQHLFAVAAGLDSMILGEPQILGQVKQAHRIARESRAIGKVLERLLQSCLATAKRVRTSTGISRNAVSVASAAVRLAQQIFADLSGRRVLVVGAGKMATLVAKHLVASGVGDVFVTSRTFHHAVQAAAPISGHPLHWADGLSRLAEVDIVISCTGAPHVVLTRTDVAAASRRRRGAPLFLIDIAVPRDVEPSVNDLDNAYLYDIDGLQGIADANMETRRAAAEHAWRLVVAEAAEFERWHKSLEVEPVIVELREHLLEIGRRETERFRRRLGALSSDQEQAVQALTRALVQKILHRPVEHLRHAVERGDGPASAAAYREIFGMSGSPAEAAPDAGVGERPGDDDDEASGPRRVLKGGKD